jgi:hypothetical protein
MTKVRNGPKCASIGLAHDAFVGVRHSSTFSRREGEMHLIRGGRLRGAARGAAAGAGERGRGQEQAELGHQPGLAR